MESRRYRTPCMGCNVHSGCPMSFSWEQLHLLAATQSQMLSELFSQNKQLKTFEGFWSRIWRALRAGQGIFCKRKVGKVNLYTLPNGMRHQQMTYLLRPLQMMTHCMKERILLAWQVLVWHMQALILHCSIGIALSLHIQTLTLHCPIGIALSLHRQAPQM